LQSFHKQVIKEQDLTVLSKFKNCAAPVMTLVGLRWDARVPWGLILFQRLFQGELISRAPSPASKRNHSSRTIQERWNLLNTAWRVKRFHKRMTTLDLSWNLWRANEHRCYLLQLVHHVIVCREGCNHPAFEQNEVKR
jgi:hypothetical protein